MLQDAALSSKHYNYYLTLQSHTDGGSWQPAACSLTSSILLAVLNMVFEAVTDACDLYLYGRLRPSLRGTGIAELQTDMTMYIAGEK